MKAYDVSVRIFKKNQSKVTNMEVLCDTPLGAGISALQSLGVECPRFTLTIKPKILTAIQEVRL